MLNSNCFCRKATLKDDFEKIAKYIHLTDPYIYPAISLNPDDKSWICFVSECLRNPSNIFFIDNISVVICESDIVGIACVIPCQKDLTIVSDINIPINISQNLGSVINGYFDPLIEESKLYSGYNIVNVCIDEKYRGKGLGSLLMSHCVDTYGHNIIHLDVIASNTSAIQLYKKYGFQIEKEYLGFSGKDTLLLCYHMTRELHKRTKAE